MFKLQLFGTEQYFLGVLGTTFSAVCWICPPGIIFGGWILPAFTCSSPMNFHKLEDCPSEERNLGISNEGPIPNPHCISKRYLAKICLFGSCIDGDFLHAAQHWQYARAAILLMHFPFRGADNFGLPTMYSCL